MRNPSDDKSAHFEPLVLEHHVRVRAFVRSLGVEPDWVDDIAQEAFVKAYNDWDSFDQSRDFGKWLRGIAANIVRNEIRKQARRQRLLHTDLTRLLVQGEETSGDTPEPVAIEAVRICLGKLSASNRAIVQGRYRDGLTAPELAEKLQKTAANVRQMLVRIRRQLRICVEHQLNSEADPA
jgi:RNA polymerase sigma-70 factor (ECF subfamily)